MATANRLHWIDTTKAVCIICVYYAHCVAFTTGNINLIKAVSPFYVNAFFFVSGYLLYKKYLQENTISNFASQAYLSGVKTCIFKIIIPTIIFSSIICIPKALFHSYTIDYKTLIIDVWGGSSFWFTSALAVAQLVILTLFLTKIKNIFTDNLFNWTDTKSFKFNLQSNGRLSKPMKFEIKDLKRGGIYLYEKSDRRLIGLGDITLSKENKKNDCHCDQDVDHFDYHGISNALCGKIHPNRFTPKRILVIQMI